MQEKINVEVILAILYWFNEITKPTTSLKILNFLQLHLDLFFFDILPSPVIMHYILERKREVTNLIQSSYEIPKEEYYFYEKIQQLILNLSPKQIETCLTDFDRYLTCCMRLDKLSGLEIDISRIKICEEIEWIE